MKERLMKQLFIILITITALGSYAVSKKDIVLFDSANSLFKEANQMAMKDPDISKKLYREAALKYKLLVDSGAGQTASILMNLGNAYFFAGDNGRALLSYHRAALINPADSDVQHNLNFVRSKCVDEVQDNFWSDVLNTIFFWHNIPFKIRLVLFSVSFTLLWIVFTMLLFKQKKSLRITAAVSMILSFVFAVSLTASYLNLFSSVDGVVTAKEAQTYQGDAYIYNSAFTTPLHSGTEFKLKQSRGGWYNIQLADKSTCWIPARDAELITPEIGKR
jgi:tetratricopeptide (TPR) repeat protein